MKVKITEFEGDVVIEVLNRKEDEDFLLPGKMKSGGFRVGCILKNTGKNLGMSPEAWKIIKSMKVTSDDIGEVNAYIKNNIHCFYWLGAPGRLISPNSELSNRGVENIDFIEISNETSQHVIDKIKEARKKHDKIKEE